MTGRCLMGFLCDTFVKGFILQLLFEWRARIQLETVDHLLDFLDSLS